MVSETIDVAITETILGVYFFHILTEVLNYYLVIFNKTILPYVFLLINALNTLHIYF